MSRTGIVDTLRAEEKSLKNQLVAIQRAIEAIELADAEPARAHRKTVRPAKAVKAAAPKRKRPLTAEQRQAISDRMKRYWSSRRKTKSTETETPTPAAD